MKRSSFVLSSFVLVACGDASPSSDTGLGCPIGTMLVGSICVPIDDSGSGGAQSSSGGASESSSVGTTVAPTDTGSSDGADDSSSGTTGEVPTAIDLHDVVFHDNPTGIADWPVTTNITKLVFSNDGVHVEFSKQEDPERWPDITPPGWEGPLQYTLGLVENIDGVWHTSAAMQYWYGLDVQGGNVAADNQIAINWYYDARWGELDGRQPATGEIVGIFVVAGNTRGVLDDGSQSPVKERSEVVVVPFPDVNGATHDF
ncbi:MAG TPA: hypothetical protein VG755_36235 [Nannocystaceae bacterium]|nr:hypothetical protein [Nannocystaceae bacterium]